MPPSVFQCNVKLKTISMYRRFNVHNLSNKLSYAHNSSLLKLIMSGITILEDQF